MNRIKMAFIAALAPAIIALIAFVAGVVLILVGVLTDAGSGFLIGGIVVIIFGAAMCGIAYNQAKQRLHAICPECQKFMGNTNSAVEYSFVCNQYKENYDSSTNKFRDFTFYYTCTVLCPHCGSTSTFEYRVNAKTAPQANSAVDKYLKGILKLKQ